MPVDFSLTYKEKPVVKSESALEPELTLDEKPAENGKKQRFDQWIKYWDEIKDGRVMASMGDLYANFKIIKKMREQGTAEEQAKAQSYLNGLREDFVWDGEKGGLVADTRLFYLANSLETRVVQHYGCRRPELTKERVIEVPVYNRTLIETLIERVIKVPVYNRTLIEEVADSGSGLTYLQTILDTEDDAETIIQTLEFIGGKSRSHINSWTALVNSDKYFTRAERSERVAWFGCYSSGLYLVCSNDLGYYYVARGVRLGRRKAPTHKK